MKFLGLRSLGRLAGAAPVIARLILGVIMVSHGWIKVVSGPIAFGEALASLGVPAPLLFGYLVTFLEFLGGIALIVGLLTRIVALLLTINMIGAIALVKVNVGLIGAEGAGAELDLALIAGFLTLALLGPGRPSLDHILGLESVAPSVWPQEPTGQAAV